MIELGAGWGRWLANAAFVVRQIRGVPVMLIGVEPEPRHFAWMKQHLSDNGINRREWKLVRAATAGADGHVWFHVGAAADWYGQAIAEGNHRLRHIRVSRRVELLDIDIQGAEADVLEPAAASLDSKVRRVYIGTPQSRGRGAATRDVQPARLDVGLRLSGWQHERDCVGSNHVRGRRADVAQPSALAETARRDIPRRN
jgi:FkbM family methyltransferase